MAMTPAESVTWDAMLAVYEEAQALIRRAQCVGCGSYGGHSSLCALTKLRGAAIVAYESLRSLDAEQAAERKRLDEEG